MRRVTLVQHVDPYALIIRKWLVAKEADDSSGQFHKIRYAAKRQLLLSRSQILTSFLWEIGFSKKAMTRKRQLLSNSIRLRIRLRGKQQLALSGVPDLMELAAVHSFVGSHEILNQLMKNGFNKCIEFRPWSTARRSRQSGSRIRSHLEWEVEPNKLKIVITKQGKAVFSCFTLKSV